VHIYNTSQVMSDASPAHPWEYQLKPAGAQHQNKSMSTGNSAAVVLVIS